MKLFFLLALFTLTVPHWLELLGIDIDGGDGQAEAIIALVVGLVVLIRLLVPFVARRRDRVPN